MSKKHSGKNLNGFTILWLLPLVVFLSLAMSSCEEDESGPRVGIVYDQAGKGDGSFNDSAYEGVKRARGELGARISEETTDGAESNREELIRSLAKDNDLVIAVGFSFENAIKKVAKEYPDVNFAGVDVLQRDNSPANLASLLFEDPEGAFLVGIAAALKTENDRVGFIGGVCETPDELIEKFEAGFIEGVFTMARTLGKDITIKTEYLSQFINPITGEPDISGFNDPDKANIVAKEMFESGSDVIFHAAGGSGEGLFEAAKQFSESEGTKVWAIGVDSDQYLTANESVREHILTSMLRRVDTAVYNIIKAQKDGEFAGKEVINNLANDGVGYATSGGFTDDIRELVEAAKTLLLKNFLNLPAKPEKGCREPQIYSN